MSKQLIGSCLCGGFKYIVENPLKDLVNCHCSMCRKAVGASFFPCFMVPRDELVLLETSTIATYKSTKNASRYFCRRCGCTTHVDDFNNLNVPGLLIAGTLDSDPPKIKLSGECFTKYKAPWQKLCEGVAHSEEYEVFIEMLKIF